MPVPFSEFEAAFQSSNGTATKAWLVHPQTDKTAFFDNPEIILNIFMRPRPLAGIRRQTMLR
jgi:hypothetical protein